MVELVCGRFVIEGRHCNCEDVEEPVQTNLLREIVLEVIAREGRELPRLERRLQ
jgi:hypothetical protein